MANRHFGKLNDVWKHLMLCEVLESYAPAGYAESHAGAGAYELALDREREFGIGSFLDAADDAAPLSDTAYRRTLSRFAPRYPGSALQAMSLLGDRADYLLCETDTASADDLRRWARQLGLTRVRVVEDDGMTTLSAWLGTVQERALVHVDPFDPHAAEPGGMSAVQLAEHVADSDAALLYWYGYHGAAERAWPLREMSPRAAGCVSSLDVLVTEASGPPRPEKAENGTAPGAGFGILLANVSPEAVRRCHRVGRHLVQAYEGRRLPSGGTTRLDLLQTTLEETT